MSLNCLSTHILFNLMFDFILASIVPPVIEIIKEIAWAGFGAICAYGMNQLISWFQ